MNRYALIAMMVLFVWLVLGSVLFTLKECGSRAFLFDNAAFYAAVSGACEE